ncbi:hypothetical protein BH09BAC3_BH09BAC3_20880 [soil metagenome]
MNYSRKDRKETTPAWTKHFHKQRAAKASDLYFCDLCAFALRTLRERLFFIFLLLSTIAMSQSIPSPTKTYAFRLGPHDDVKKSILEFAKTHKIKAGCIVTAVGSLEQFNIRYANQENGEVKKGHFEIVSLTGTFSDTSSHLHLSVSDSTGVTTGGHLLDENLIFTTLEIIVSDLADIEFTREKDTTYGYPELVIKPRARKSR